MNQSSPDTVGINTSVLLKLIRQNPTAAICLMYFCEHMDENNSLMCSDSVLQDVCQTNKKKVAAAIQIMQYWNLITVHEADGTKTYVVNSDIAVINPPEGKRQ